MAENIPDEKLALAAVRQKRYLNGEPLKRTALSVINGNKNFEKNPVEGIKKYIEKRPLRSCQLNKKANEFKSSTFNIFEDENSTLPLNNEIREPAVQEDKVLPVSVSSGSEKEETKTPQVLESSNEANGAKTEDKVYSLLWCSPYKADIYSYLKEVEKKCRPRPTYMLKQPDISHNMRSVLVDWLIEVGEEYKLQAQTIHLAVSYVDRFLSRMSVLRGKLQLVGTSCMFIAAKYEEIYPPELKDFAYITDDTYTKKQILRMEHLILKVLAFDIAPPTAYSFLQIFCCMASAPQLVSNLAQYICEISLLDGDPFLKFLPSEIAASSLALANLKLGSSAWSEDLEKITGFSLSDLKNVIKCLYGSWCIVSAYPQQAVYEKYSKNKFQCVAGIQSPKELIL
ncbi:G2/mitotic-specific cyclin-A-like [Stegodyphus dumicola]|uniref:G2/mitotic-specific cyclin-A-like n=1 Tax=Stegodyphus dumicola TaxID=202533 RepID=UPI0015ABEF7E|nr:G2/mitotic-specific cyclin-A-like [Stegodyphus dumicola]